MTYDARYAKLWTYARARGILQWVPVHPSRTHINELLNMGFTSEAIGNAAGISGSAVRSIAGRYAPTENISRHVAKRINALTPAAVFASITERTVLVPSLGAKRRVQALQAIGHTLTDIDAATGARPRLAKYVADRAPGMSITFDKHCAIVRAYEALWDKPGRSGRSRRLAQSRGLVPPLAWDDDRIDDPDATPDMGGGTDRVNGGHGRRAIDVVEDIEWLLLHDPTLTSAQLAHRLGYTGKSSIQHALDRAGRPDLLARLARNAEAAA